MTSWVAIGYGALDLRSRRIEGAEGADYIVLAAYPAAPVGLSRERGELWMRLVDAPVEEKDLSAGDLEQVRQFAEFGIASSDLAHPARICHVAGPWMSSPFHELVSALACSVGKKLGISCVIVKGPTLYQQGLRTREHSGDVDVWVDPARLPEFIAGLKPWGWKEQRGLWSGIPTAHSVTLEAEVWGCEIDVHRYMPGPAVSPTDAFSALLGHVIPQEFAGIEGGVPDAASHAVISALHTLRPNVIGEPARQDIGSAITLLRDAGADGLAFARDLRAIPALGEALQRAFPEDAIVAGYSAPLEWTWRAHGSRRRSLIDAFWLVPPRYRAIFLARVLWPTRAEVLASDRLAGGDGLHPFRARLRRLWRGLRSAHTKHDQKSSEGELPS